MSKKIRVCHHSKTVGYSGTDRTAQLFCKYLAASEKYEPFIVYREGNVNNQRLDIVRKWLGDDHVLPYTWDPGKSGGVPPYIPESHNLDEVLAEIDPDIVHIHRSGFAEWPGVRKLAPKARWVETNIFGHTDGTVPPQIDVSLFVSKFIKAHNPGLVLYNPIELPFHEVNKANRLMCREKLLRRFGLTDDAIIMGRVGRADNFDPISLRAFKKVQADHPNAHYLVVNPCDGWRDCAKALHLENVEFVPCIVDDQELSEFYMGLDLYAHARSDGETFGVSIAEAMMHGIPVISHYTGAYNAQAEIIESGGFCVPVGDDDGYAKVLDQLLSHANVREHFGHEGRRRAMRDFEASCIASKLAGIYDWVLEK